MQFRTFENEKVRQILKCMSLINQTDEGIRTVGLGENLIKMNEQGIQFKVTIKETGTRD